MFLFKCLYFFASIILLLFCCKDTTISPNIQGYPRFLSVCVSKSRVPVIQENRPRDSRGHTTDHADHAVISTERSEWRERSTALEMTRKGDKIKPKNKKMTKIFGSYIFSLYICRRIFTINHLDQYGNIKKKKNTRRGQSCR